MPYLIVSYLLSSNLWNSHVAKEVAVPGMYLAWVRQVQYGKVAMQQAVNVRGRRGSKVLRFLDLDTRVRWVVNCLIRPADCHDFKITDWIEF